MHAFAKMVVLNKMTKIRIPWINR